MIKIKEESRKVVTKTPRTVTEIRALSRKVGRPRDPNAMTAAERQRKRRTKKIKTDAEWLEETVNADG